MDQSSILTSLAEQGFRISKTRKHVVNLLADCQKPHSVPELLQTLKESNPTLNKTTLYRELAFLKDQGIVTEIEFGEGKKRYEISQNHHHHIICTKCDKVEDVPFTSDVERHEENIVKTMKFSVTGHSLEFFGVCESCQQ